MANHDDQDILRLVERLANIEPSPESTQRAVMRARHVLSSERLHKPSRNWRTSMPIRIAAGIITVVGATGLLTWLMPAESSSNLVLADVQERMAKTRSVTFKQTELRKGRPPEISRTMISGPNLRAEFPNGDYSITNLKDNKAMAVSHEQKRVHIFLGFAVQQQPNLYDRIRNIRREATKKLPEREIDGKKVVGFLVTMGEGEGEQGLKVWVDPETKLPIRFEAGSDRETKVVISDFVFDRELDASLFSMTPPKGYTVETFGVAKLQPEPDEKTLAALVVTPLVGIGPVKFGMSKEEVIEALGKPDKVLKMGGGEQLEYYSLGFGALVSHTRGLLMVTCYSQKFFAIQVRDFKGKTDKGIDMGASKADIVNAYGKFDREDVSRNKDVFGEDTDKPEEETGQTTLYYDDLRLWFSLYYDKVFSITIRAPR